MNSISKQIGFDYEKSKALPEMIISGEKYRFTVLSESLIRIEYSEDGVFEDRPTLLIRNRLFKPFSFINTNDGSKIKIETKYFKLTYAINKQFKGTSLMPDSNLKVELINNQKKWYYGHPEVRNLGAPGKELTDESGKQSFVKGLFSLDGFVCVDDSKTPVILENGSAEKRENKIDLYLFMYAQDFGKCLNDYFALTGYPPMLPRYAFGNWWSKDYSYNDEELKGLIKEFDDNSIPISLIYLNHDWHINKFNEKERIQSGFTFDNEKFKNYVETIRYVHSKNFKLGLSINPTEGIYPYEETYNNFKNMVNSDSEIIPFNAFDSNTYVAYFNLLIKPLLDNGVDAFWLYGKKMDRMEQSMLNVYHTENVLNSAKRILLLTSNTLVAPHRYPVLYPGNSIVSWETLKKIPFHNLSAANIGVSFWSHDIGGFHKGIEDNELYRRFVQLGVFSPILKLGSAGGKYYKREPWLWEVKTYRIVRDYLKLRHRLIPYLYNEMYKYHKTGMPIIKPLYYKVPKVYDDSIYRNEYYFGSEFFVAPITYKKDYNMNRVIHRFYLPEGTWYEFFSGKKFEGGKRYLYFVKDEDYPAFVKAGGIIPMNATAVDNSVTVPNIMEIQIFPGSDNSYNLYEDDGITYEYKNGRYIVTNIDYKYLENNYIVNIKPISGRSGVITDFRTYKLRFRNTKVPDKVTVTINNESKHYIGMVDENDYIVEISNVSTKANLVVNISGENLNIKTNRIINEEIESILNDLLIETELKEKIDEIIFSNLTVQKKRIAIRKLTKKGLETRFMNLFLKLLEYVE